MQAPHHLVQAELQAPHYRDRTKLQPLCQHLAQIFNLWSLVEANDIEVDAVGPLEISRGKQMRHKRGDVLTGGMQHQHQARRVLVIRLIPQVVEQWELFGPHLSSDLFQDFGARDLIRQSGDDNIAMVLLVTCAHTDGASAGLIEAYDFLTRRDDLRLSGKIRALDVGTQLFHRRPGMLQKMDTGVNHFPEIVRWDIRGHADRNTRGAVEQDMWQAGWEDSRLMQCAVEVGPPVHRALLQLG